MKIDIQGTVTFKRGKEFVNLSGNGVEVSDEEAKHLLKLDCCRRSGAAEAVAPDKKAKQVGPEKPAD